MSASMRAKMKVVKVTLGENVDVIEMLCVAARSYPQDGLHEDNTFAKFSPSGEFKIHVTNPNLLGKHRPGEFYYVDFTPVPDELKA